MDLRNSLEHARNTVVTVNGHDYQIDAHGVAHGVNEVDAKKMLRNAGRVWSEIPRREAVKAAQPREASETPMPSTAAAPAAPTDAGAQRAPAKRVRTPKTAS